MINGPILPRAFRTDFPPMLSLAIPFKLCSQLGVDEADAAIIPFWIGQRSEY